MCFSAASIEIGKTHESLAAEEGTTTVNGARLPAWVHCGAVGVFTRGCRSAGQIHSMIDAFINSRSHGDEVAVGRRTREAASARN